MPHIILEQTELLTALNSALQIVDSRSKVEFYTGICFIADAGELQIKSANLDAWFTRTLSEVTGNKASFLVDAKKICATIGRLPAGSQVHLEYDEANCRLNIKSSKKTFNLPCLAPDAFPNITVDTKNTTSFEFNATLFRQALAKTYIATANDEARYFLCGVYMHAEKNTLTFVATDGHKLIRNQFTDFKHEFKGVIIPRAQIQPIIKMITDLTSITILVSDAKLTIVGPGFTFTTKLIDGTYPEYNRVIPEAHPCKIEFNVDHLINATQDVAAAIVGWDIGSVQILHKDNQLIAATTDAAMAVGECRSIINDNYELENVKNFRMAFQGRYLLDLLNIIKADIKETDSETITLEFNDKLQPAVLRPTENTQTNSNLTIILMPMRA